MDRLSALELQSSLDLLLPSNSVICTGLAFMRGDDTDLPQVSCKHRYVISALRIRISGRIKRNVHRCSPVEGHNYQTSNGTNQALTLASLVKTWRKKEEFHQHSENLRCRPLKLNVSLTRLSSAVIPVSVQNSALLRIRSTCPTDHRLSDFLRQ